MKVVWEPKWRYAPEVPEVGDYVQVKVEVDWQGQFYREGIVRCVRPGLGFSLHNDRNSAPALMLKWRRGALPEEKTTQRVEERKEDA